MIPDDTFIFKHYGVPRIFDDHEVRLRHHLQKDTMAMLESGRHLLLACPVCKHPWYKAGSQEYPRLTPEQLALLGATLHIDIHSLHLLPRAFCPLCSAVYLGGMLSVEEYPQRMGYRFLWESASPRHLWLLALVYRRDGRTFHGLVPLSLESLMHSMHHACSVLAWLEECPLPETIRAWSDDQCQHMTWRTSPKNLVQRCVCQWPGYAWDVPCPPLGGDALVFMAVAGDAVALAPLTSLLLSWSILARTMRTVL